MYPYTILGFLDLYTVFMCIGIAGAIIIFRVLAQKKKIPWKVQQLVVITAAASIFAGYYSAIFFQALYNIDKLGKFVIDENTGMTFYGGLIGGAAAFLLIYFGIGYFLFKKDHANTEHFFSVADIAASSILFAHGAGRIGCLMAGCCHGGVTDSWCGMPMLIDGKMQKAVPIQLFEALFLFALCGWLTYRLLKGKTCNLPIYMAFYGVWRFAVEFFRADERGSTFVSFLSPSQLIAVLMIAGSVALYFGQRAAMKYFVGKKAARLDTEVIESVGSSENTDEADEK